MLYRIYHLTVVSMALFLAAPAIGQEVSDRATGEATLTPVSASETSRDKRITRTFSLANHDATRMKRLIAELLGNSQVPQDTAWPRIRLAAEPATNSLIVSGTEGDLQVVQSLLERLDLEETARQSTKIYRLKNAPATDVAQAISQWLEVRSKMAGDHDEVPAPKHHAIVPEPVSNSLIVSTRLDAGQARELDSIIRALDSRPDMVKIQIVIRKTVAGKETVLSRPTIVTIDQLPSRVTVGSKDESLTVELTPFIVRDTRPTEVATIPENQTIDR